MRMDEFTAERSCKQSGSVLHSHELHTSSGLFHTLCEHIYSIRSIHKMLMCSVQVRNAVIARGASDVHGGD